MFCVLHVSMGLAAPDALHLASYIRASSGSDRLIQEICDHYTWQSAIIAIIWGCEARIAVACRTLARDELDRS